MNRHRKKDLYGKKFGVLFVIGLSAKRDKKGSAFWWCQCVCGELICVRRDTLVLGKRTSCGCMRKKRPWGERVCDYCGKTFRNNREKKYCSNRCIELYRDSKKIDRSCKFCGKAFKVSPAIFKTNASANFCCKHCYSQHQKTLTGEKNNRRSGEWLPCHECAKQIWVIKSSKVLYKRHFCSLGCRSKFYSKELSGENNSNWRGGHIKRKGDFASVKTRNFKGNSFCSLCGTTKYIHIHHIIPYRHTHDNSLSNLIPLCRSCHKIVENITWDIIDAGDGGDYSVEKTILNNILRTYQAATYVALKKIQERERV